MSLAVLAPVPMVVGSIVKAGSEIRIDAQLEDLSTGRVLAADSVRGTDCSRSWISLPRAFVTASDSAMPAAMRHVAEVSTSSLDAYRYYSEGLTAYNNTRSAGCPESVEKAVAIDPAFAQAYLHLALVTWQMGLTGDSEKYAAKAAQHADRLNERQHLLLTAELARNAGDYGKAVKALDEVIAKYPDLEEAYAVACRIHHPVIGPLQNPRRFVDITEAGVAAVPSSTLILNFHGYALLDAGRYPEAVRVFESYARLAPREPNPYDSLGEAHIKMGMPEKAIEYFSKALTIHPTFFPSHVGRAWGLSMLGRYDEAIAEDPTFPFLRGFMLSRVGRYREAEEHVAFDISRVEANKNVVEQGVVHLISAVLALERKQPGLAATRLRQPAQLFAQVAPERQRVHVVLTHTIAGLANIQAGRLEDARARLDAQRRIVDSDVAPQQWWHKLLEGEIALAEGNPQKAEAALRPANLEERCGCTWPQRL